MVISFLLCVLLMNTSMGLCPRVRVFVSVQQIRPNNSVQTADIWIKKLNEMKNVHVEMRAGTASMHVHASHWVRFDFNELIRCNVNIHAEPHRWYADWHSVWPIVSPSRESPSIVLIYLLDYVWLCACMRCSHAVWAKWCSIISNANWDWSGQAQFGGSSNRRLL